MSAAGSPLDTGSSSPGPRSSREGAGYTATVALEDVPVEDLRCAAAASRDERALYVFGSRVTGTSRLDSDLDVGVLYHTPQPLERTLELEATLAGVTRLRVDLVDVTRAGAFLALEVVRGERVFCEDEDAADRFELHVLARAGDLLPFEHERQRLALGSFA